MSLLIMLRSWFCGSDPPSPPHSHSPTLSQSKSEDLIYIYCATTCISSMWPGPGQEITYGSEWSTLWQAAHAVYCFYVIDRGLKTFMHVGNVFCYQGKLTFCHNVQQNLRTSLNTILTWIHRGMKQLTFLSALSQYETFGYFHFCNMYWEVLYLSQQILMWTIL